MYTHLYIIHLYIYIYIKHGYMYTNGTQVTLVLI